MNQSMGEILKRAAVRGSFPFMAPSDQDEADGSGAAKGSDALTNERRLEIRPATTTEGARRQSRGVAEQSGDEQEFIEDVSASWED